MVEKKRDLALDLVKDLWKDGWAYDGPSGPTNIKSIHPSISNKWRVGNSNATVSEINEYFSESSSVRISRKESEQLKQYQELLKDIEEDEMIAEAWNKFVAYVRLRKDADEQPSYKPKLDK